MLKKITCIWLMILMDLLNILTKILNDYDKNYFEKNKKLFLKKINEEKYILKEQNEEYEQDDNNNRNSNSKEGIFNLEESNQEQNQEKSPSQNQDNEKENSNENEYQENEPKKIKQDKNNKYSDYPEKMLNLINIIRSDPASYADIIEDSIQNITEEQDRNDESKTRIIYKKKVKVALNRGEIAFKDAADELRNMEPLPPLELIDDICVPLPEEEAEIKDSSYLREQVKVLREKTNIDVFFKDLDNIKSDDIKSIIIGNKIDLEDKRIINKSDLENLANKYKMSFLEVSAKNNININEAFDLMVNEILKEKDENTIIKLFSKYKNGKYFKFRRRCR